MARQAVGIGTRTQAHHAAAPKPALISRALADVLQRCGGVSCPPGTCDHDETPTLHRSATSAGHAPTIGHSAAHVPGTVPPIVHQVLRSPGRPLDAATRAYMEPRFGHDFGHVRVHTDAHAAQSAAAVHARAYTVGHHIVMGGGEYRPGATDGRRLLAHELGHVIQQAGSTDAIAADGVTPNDHPTERQADAAADAVIRDQPLSIGRRPIVALQRQAKATAASSGGQSGASTTPWDRLPADARKVVGKNIFNGFSPAQQAVFQQVYGALKSLGYWTEVCDVKDVNVKYHQIDANVSAKLERRLLGDARFCADEGVTNIFHPGKSFRQVVRPGSEGLHISIQSNGFATLHLDTVSPVIGRSRGGSCEIGAGVGLEHLFRDVWHIRGELPRAVEPGEMPF
jgi:hypothetical protein